MRKRWFLVALLVAILGLGITGGITLAKTSSSSDDPPWADFASRVASILRLGEVEVYDAFHQAFKENQDEAVYGCGRGGCVTEEQVDQYIQWYQSRPEWVCPDRQLFEFRSCKFKTDFFYAGSPLPGLASRVASILGLDGVKVKRAFDRAQRDFQDEIHLERLKQYVEEGSLTQREADQYYEWFQSRPEGVLPGRSHCQL